MNNVSLKTVLCYVARDLNKIDDLMQDITEQQDVAQEISEAISNRAAFGDEFDEVSIIVRTESWL